MSSEYNVGDLVADFLAQCDVSTAFGVISVHNIPILDAIARRNATRFVMTRGEMGAAHMADAYARVSGGLGAVVTSTGPGAANAVSGIVEADFASTPLLHITGQTISRALERRQGGVHDVRDQLGMLQAIGKAAYRVRSASEAFGILKRAATEAMATPRGPVSIEIPIDIQRTRIERPAGLDNFRLPTEPTRLEPAPAEMDELARRVLAAKRPMIWAGSGARDAGDIIARFLDLGFGMATSWAGRGMVGEDHPMNLGGLNGIGAPAVEAFYGTVDLLLVVGSRMRFHETTDGGLKLPPNLVQIDVDPSADGRTYANTHFVCGDARSTLTALLERVSGKLSIESGYAEEFRSMKRRAKQDMRETLGPYSSFSEQLREALPRDGIFARDITLSHTTWGHKLFQVYGPRDSVYPVGAAIGPGLQLGIGAAIGGGGRKVVAMCGDGGFFLNATEFWTAVQENVDIVVIVMNDNGYGVIKHIQDSVYGGRRYFGDLLSPSIAGFAELAGVPFWKVSAADDFGPTVSKALATGGPTIVEVDMMAIGEFPPYFPYNNVKAKEAVKA